MKRDSDREDAAEEYRSGRTYRSNRSFADGLEYEAKIITIRELRERLLKVVTAEQHEDIFEATDLKIVFQGTGKIAARMRRDTCTYRDLTIRSKVRNRMTGEFMPTEIDKLPSSGVEYYFYAWQQGSGIGTWMIVDIQKVFASGMLENVDDVENPDGYSWFKPIRAATLYARKMLIASSLFRKARCCMCKKEVPFAEHLLADGKCVWCAMHEQEADDRRRWEGVKVAAPSETEAITHGPYKGFKVSKGDLTPDPARAAKCLREAKEFQIEQEEWRKKLLARKKFW